jgi:hypothetical protein
MGVNYADLLAQQHTPSLFADLSDETPPEPVDRERIRAFARHELSEPEMQWIAYLVSHFRTWHEVWNEIDGEVVQQARLEQEQAAATQKGIGATVWQLIRNAGTEMRAIMSASAGTNRSHDQLQMQDALTRREGSRKYEERVRAVIPAEARNRIQGFRVTVELRPIGYPIVILEGIAETEADQEAAAIAAETVDFNHALRNRITVEKKDPLMV